MNVTIKIADELCLKARHRAVDAGLSLSAWIAVVIGNELFHGPSKPPKTLLEALGNDQLSELPLDFPRNETMARAADFS